MTLQAIESDTLSAALDTLRTDDTIDRASLSCGSWVGEDDRCGNPAVATDRNSERGICDTCLADALDHYVLRSVYQPRGMVLA